MQRTPEFATLAGQTREYNNRLEEFTEERFKEDFDTCKEFHSRATSLLEDSNSDNDKSNLEFFIAEVSTFIDGFSHGGFYFPINFRSGPQVDFQKLTAWASPTSLEDYEDLLARYRQLPKYMEQTMEMMRSGMAKNITAHLASMEAVPGQIESHLTGEVEESVLFKPFRDLQSKRNFSQTEVKRLQAGAKAIIKSEIRPAFKKLLRFISEEYQPSCRTNIAASSLPGGQFYQACIRFHTTTNFTAEDIHALGISEVANIEAEMRKVIEELQLNLTVKEFFSTLRNDPANYFGSGEEVLSAFNTTINEKILAKLPTLFKRIPSMRLEIVEESNPEASAASYIAGTEDGSRPGRFYVNTAKYASQSRHGVATLVLHEAYPGHHLQGAYLQGDKYPTFRKVMEDRAYSLAPSRFPINTAYAEGWALYSETLGYQLGLFDDPMARFGHLNAMIFRACRLVVDTGLHAFGWSRERAIEYMLEHTARSRDNIEREVNRYITWPGQALGYKIGQLKISELRQRAETHLKESFDIKDFHEVILESAGPLSIVEKKVEEWMKAVMAK